MKALIVRADDAAQVLVDYINAANDVAQYAASLSATQLPVLVTPPTSYGDYGETLGDAKLHALTWIDEMLPSFTAIPAAMLDYNALVQPQLANVGAGLQALEQDPGDTAAREAIESAISVLQNELAPSLNAIGDLGSWIAQYSALIAPDASGLSQLCTQIATAESADQAAMAQLDQALASLNELVAARNELATLDKIGNAVLSIFLAVAGVAIGVPFSGPAAIIVGLGFGIASAAYTSFEPVDSPPDYQQSLAEIQTEMNSVNTEIGSVNAIVGMLQATANQFTELVSASAQASSNAQEVLTFWQGVGSDLSATVADIDQVLDDLVADGSIADALAALQQAQQTWSTLESYLSNVKTLTYQISPTIDLPPVSPPR